MKHLTALYKSPFGRTRKIKIADILEAYQEAVGGYIEVIQAWNLPNVVIICNEEGRLDGLKENVRTQHGAICGNIVIIGVDGEDFRSLTDDEIERVLQILSVATINRYE